MSKIVCVVPSIRPERMEEFRKVWAHLFEKHGVSLITVWDGEEPRIEVWRSGGTPGGVSHSDLWNPLNWSMGEPQPSAAIWDVICRRTDAVRNLGFLWCVRFKPDFILTLDDDVHPPAGSDPIQEHLDVLQRRVPISWMNTALPGMIDNETLYLRGFPYDIRDEAPVKVSHGVWVNVPDFDGRTQLELTNNGKCPESLPYSLPYFRGPVPRGVYFPFCGMNVMVHRDALPYLYFAPMGWDAGCEGLVDKDGLVRGPALNRFADIWCGILLKRAMDANDWAIYTGASTIIHTRASDPFVNVEQEKLGIEWNERAWKTTNWPLDYQGLPSGFKEYWRSYLDKAARFRDLIRKLQGAE